MPKRLFILLYFVKLPLAIAGEGLQLLDNMSEAMRTQTYSGTFLYRHKDKVETLKILHRKTADYEQERLLTLSGEPREVIRDGVEVTCIWPDSRLVMVDKSRQESHFPGFVPENLDNLIKYYDVKATSQTKRIANRLCSVIDIKPRDEYRYGYRICVDQATQLLLQSDLLDDQGKSIEQVMFTELQTHATLPDSAFAPELKTDGFRLKEMGRTDNKTKPVAKSLWRANVLPPGFSVHKHSQRVKDKSNAVLNHFVYSDGLASVSVFIEPQADSKITTGKKRRGALNVFGRVVSGHNVTVVGEVPEGTVKLIAQSIEYSQ